MDGRWRIDYFGRGTNRIASTSWRDTEDAAYRAAEKRRETDSRIGRARVSYEPYAGRLRPAGSVYARRYRRNHAALHSRGALVAGLAVAAAAAALVVFVIRSTPAPPALTA